MLQSTDPSCSALDPFNYSFPLEAGRLPSELPGISPAPSPSLGANARSLELLGSSKTGFASGMTLSNQLIVKSNTHTYSYYVFYMHAICTEIIYFSSVTISFLLLALFFFTFPLRSCWRQLFLLLNTHSPPLTICCNSWQSRHFFCISPSQAAVTALEKRIQGPFCITLMVFGEDHFKPKISLEAEGAEKSKFLSAFRAP